VAAVDLGATSGRVMVAEIGAGRFELTEVHRFANQPTVRDGHLRWDFESIWANVVEGLRQAAAGGPVDSVGIDSWAVDYGLLGPDGALREDPICYRDDRTAGAPERVWETISQRRQYELTGLQHQRFNTIYQLAAAAGGERPAVGAPGDQTSPTDAGGGLAASQDTLTALGTGGGVPGASAQTSQAGAGGCPAASQDTLTALGTGGGVPGAARGSALARAARLLMIPDLLAYRLTGRAVTELTNASTTGLFDVRRRAWSNELIGALGLAGELFAPIVEPGDVIGQLTGQAQAATGLGPDTLVVAVGSHDTASAVAAVPATGPDFAYISSGTWSLVGVETATPVLTEASQAANFTNELGVGGRVRYLKNVMGLWLLTECQRAWAAQGDCEPLAELLAGAARVPAGGALVDATDPQFLAPGDMPTRIRLAVAASGGRVPANRFEMVRCVLDSLAQAYRQAIAEASALAGQAVRRIHVVGGGSRNALLCAATADATGLPVWAGPAEASAIGNALIQAHALGVVGAATAADRADPASRESAAGRGHGVGAARPIALAQLRTLVAGHFPVTVYEPSTAN
jgi:rhamnulokinase